jgi:hypothetical protein
VRSLEGRKTENVEQGRSDEKKAFYLDWNSVDDSTCFWTKRFCGNLRRPGGDAGVPQLGAYRFWL